MMLQRFISIIIAMLLGGFLFAQKCTLTISGRILDKATKEPLEYTSVAFREGNRSVIADSAGYFRLGGFCAGAYHIQIYHVGCPPGHYYVTVSRDTVFTFYLEHHSQLLREIVVEGETGSYQESQTRQTLTASMIRNRSGQSLADLVDEVTGVRSLRNGGGIAKPVIHGMFGNRVAIINNGLLQAGQQWGVDHAPEIDPNTADRITVVKGSDAIEYGSQALGGAVIVEAGPILRDPHLHGTVGYTFTDNGRAHVLQARINSSMDKFDWRVTSSLKKAGDQSTPDYFLTNTGTSEYGGSLQTVFRPSEHTQHHLYYSYIRMQPGIFAGAHISNLTDLEEAIGRERPFNVRDDFAYSIAAPRQKVDHHLLKYSGKKIVEEFAFWEWTYGLQLNHRQEFDIRRGDRSEKPALDMALWSHALQTRYLNDRGKVRYKWGAQFRWTDNTNDAQTGILPLIPDYREGQAGLFGVGQYPKGVFTLEAGARYDLQAMRVWAITNTLPREIITRNHIMHDVALSAGVRYNPAADLETRMQHVLARRAPEANELYSAGLHQGVAGIEEGDWNLRSETSIKSMLTQMIEVKSFFHAEVTIYSHLIRDYIYLRPEDELRLTIRGAFPVYTYVQEHAWLRGVDVIWVSDFSHHLEWMSSLSWIRGTTISDQRSISLLPPLQIKSMISWAFHDHRVWKSSKVQVEGIYHARQRQWDVESELLEPPDDYFLLTLRFATGIKIRQDVLHFSVACDNVLNTRYRDYLNRLRYFADEPGRSVSIRLRFDF